MTTIQLSSGDGYTNDIRPDAVTATVNGMAYRWSRAEKGWKSVSTFLPRSYAPIIAQWNARDLLESPPPPGFHEIFTQNAFGDPSPSSGTNAFYATLGRLVRRPFPYNLKGYYEVLSRYSTAFNPVLEDPTLMVNNESDTVYLMRLYIVSPVCVVLAKSTQYSVSTKSKETVSDGGTTCRVDLSFTVHFSPSASKTFAVMEFKRPGSIKEEEWVSVLDAPVTMGSMGQGADVICRQLHKYAAMRETPYVGVCDGIALVMLQLGGTKQSWKASAPYQAPKNEAAFWWVMDIHEMKRYLFLWLHCALQECIDSWHAQTIGNTVMYVPPLASAATTF